MSIYRKLAFLLLLNLMPFWHIIRAQIYPAQVITEITPPYSVYLSDYTTPGTGKLAVNILLTDISKFNYPVKLRLVIEGEGITISTSSTYMPEQIILDGGSPLRLSGDELSGYFNPKNLDFKGYSKEKFIKTGALPEGIYRIGFQALDYNKRIAVSLTGSATAWLVLNDPPIFNIPDKNIKLTASEPQNIMFQWMPRHLGSPNSAFSSEYLFQVYEIWPNGRNPNEVVAATQPLIEKTTTSTTFLYSNTTETALIPGRQYAYRVQARDVEGRDLFRNKGYSEVQMFTYGDPCNVPTQIEAQSTSSGKIAISWEPTTYNTAYYVQYREAGNTNGVWYPKNTYVNSLTIDNLKTQTKYEYQIQGQCGTVNSDFSELLSVTTQPKKETKVVCGLEDPAIAITNTLPLTSLLPSDIITSGKFETQVTKATGGNGNWTGEGFMRVPFMGVKVRVTFTDVDINEKFQVTKGRIESVYNPDSKIIAQVGANKQSDTTTQAPLQTGSQDTTSLSNNTANTVTITSPIDTIVKNNNGDMLIISQNGDTTTIHTSTDGTTIAISAGGDTTLYNAGETPTLVGSDGNAIALNNGGGASSNSNSGGASSTHEQVSFAVQQNLLKIGYGQNIPVTFAIYHDLRDTTNASVKFGVDNATFNKKNSLAFLEDKDPSTGKPAPMYGDKFYHMAWIPKLEMEPFPQVGKHELTFTLLKNNNQLAEKKLEIEVLPKYDLTGLTATDANNTKRVAKAGETLYLVAKRTTNNDLPNRKIIYNSTTTSPDGTYWPGEPYWKTDGTVQDFVGKKYERTTKNWPTLENFSLPGKNTIEVFAYDKNYSVNIEWLRENKQSSSIVPFNMKPKIDQLTKIGNVLTTQIKNLGGIFKNAGVEAKTEFKFSTITYNTEDKNSRLYKKAQDAAFSYSAKLETTDLPIPGISTPLVLNKFIKLGAFWSIKVEGKYQVNLMYESLCTSQTLSFAGVKTIGSIEGGLKLGLIANILPNIKDYMKIEAKGYASIGVIGLFELYLPDGKDFKYKLQLKTAPVVLGWSANIKLVDWELVDYKSEIVICDSYNIGCIGTNCE